MADDAMTAAAALFALVDVIYWETADSHSLPKKRLVPAIGFDIKGDGTFTAKPVTGRFPGGYSLIRLAKEGCGRSWRYANG